MIELGVPLLLLAALLLVGVHIGASLAISGSVGVAIIADWHVAFRLLGESPYFTTSTYILSTIPMFVLMAEFLTGGAISHRLFHAANVWTSRFPGGLAVATIGASAGMGAMSGVSAASSATIASVAVPEMRKYGYADRLSLGVVAAGGTLSVLIPPSVTLIVFGVLTETSISSLFIAGIVPGILTTLAYSLVIVIWVSKNSDLAPRSPGYSFADRVQGLVRVWPVIVLFVIVLGGLYSGVVTPTEAGALGAAGAFIISVVVGGLRLRGTLSAIVRAIRTTCMVFFILIGANIFATYLALTRVAQDLSTFIAEHTIPKILVIIAVGIMFLVLGMFLDTLSVVVLTVPIIFPLLGSLGLGAIWIGIFTVKMIEIGLITPPVGMNIFTTVGAVENASLQDAFSGAARFIWAELGVAILIVVFPAIVYWLPNTMSG